jgi:hypothetical protein
MSAVTVAGNKSTEAANNNFPRIPNKVTFDDFNDSDVRIVVKLGKLAARLNACLMDPFPEELDTWQYLVDTMKSMSHDMALLRGFKLASTDDRMKRMVCRVVRGHLAAVRVH